MTVVLTHAQRLMRHSDPRLTRDGYTVADVEALRAEWSGCPFSAMSQLCPETVDTALGGGTVLTGELGRARVRTREEESG